MKLCLALLLLAALAVSRVKSTCSIVGGLDDPDLASGLLTHEFVVAYIDHTFSNLFFLFLRHFIIIYFLPEKHEELSIVASLQKVDINRTKGVS